MTVVQAPAMDREGRGRRLAIVDIAVPIQEGRWRSDLMERQLW